MIEILETEDVVRLNFLKTILEEADLHPFIFDTSSTYRQLPSRLLVPNEEEGLARQIIADAEAGL